MQTFCLLRDCTQCPLGFLPFLQFYDSMKNVMDNENCNGFANGLCMMLCVVFSGVQHGIIDFKTGCVDLSHEIRIPQLCGLQTGWGRQGTPTLMHMREQACALSHTGARTLVHMRKTVVRCSHGVLEHAHRRKQAVRGLVHAGGVGGLSRWPGPAQATDRHWC